MGRTHKVLQILEINQLYVKRSKCASQKEEVEYLVHIFLARIGQSGA